MRRFGFLLTLAMLGIAMLATVHTAPSQDTSNFPAIGKVHRLDPALDTLLPKDARIEVVASGFDWSEGPVWINDDGGYLLFSDIPRNSIYKWQEGKGISLWMKPSGYTGVANYGAEPGSNGLTLDADGRLTLCEHGDRRIARLEKNGGKRTLVDNYQGKRLNSPNDLVHKSDGTLYFTDPIYGLPKRENDPARELDFCGVYRLARNGELTLLTKEMSRPNGIAFSPDEKTLYVSNSDSARAVWMSFPVKGDGTTGEGRVLYDATASMGKLPGAPDGFKLDQKGNLWATGPGGVYVISPAGKLLGRLETGERTSNIAWGNDGSVLYITSDMYICRVRTSTKGNGW
ncbi:MAG: SMP-30/gluconolactonase/LRE family protein [Bryobacterales bacterium]|nr:SMP-30/gluconolactonase/LRE family protein [Bryobacterales bacterium]